MRFKAAELPSSLSTKCAASSSRSSIYVSRLISTLPSIKSCTFTPCLSMYGVRICNCCSADSPLIAVVKKSFSTLFSICCLPFFPFTLYPRFIMAWVNSCNSILAAVRAFGLFAISRLTSILPSFMLYPASAFAPKASALTNSIFAPERAATLAYSIWSASLTFAALACRSVCRTACCCAPVIFL